MWSFLARLRERKLAHWAIAYLAGAWLLLQVLDLLAQPFAWYAGFRVVGLCSMRMV